MQLDSPHLLINPKHRDIFNGLTAALDALKTLEQDGFEIIGVDQFRKSTTIQVCNSDMTKYMIDQDIAYYYRWEKDAGQHQRYGQFQIGACRVIWVERGR